VPIDRPALTVNRLCGSGIQSIVSAAQMIQLGEAQVVLAGGMENMSQAPHVLRGARDRLPLRPAKPSSRTCCSRRCSTRCAVLHGADGRERSRRRGIPREAQDEYALRSHQLGAEAVKSGKFADEIVPVEIQTRKKACRRSTRTTTSSRRRRWRALEAAAAFGKDGTVTAGNASGIVDGAARRSSRRRRARRSSA
jgi:acetyl-CoA acyltransferase 2